MDACRHPAFLRHLCEGTDPAFGRLPFEVSTERGGGDEPSQYPLTIGVEWGSLQTDIASRVVCLDISRQSAVLARRCAGDGDGTVLP